MNYISVCSGIEAATVAWHSLGWKAAAYSEIEPFPSAVLAHHYPDVPNVGDMTKYKEWNIEPGSVDLLVGGTPCQSFSVAGLRKGLADPRGNLALVYCGILDHFKPQWFVWENVPGVLSSGSGRDFGSFLGAVAELGYGFAYRVLDAQYFGVAQRRRRVFVVAYLGDWRPAAKVLFERESLRGDPAPSRKKGEAVARSAAFSAGNSSNARSIGYIEEGAPPLRAGASGTNQVPTCITQPCPVEIGPSGGRFTDLNPTLDARAKDGPIRNQLAGAVMQPYPIDNTLTAKMHKGVNSTVDEGQTPVVTAYAVRTANTSANGHGVAAEVTHTLDQAQGQAVAVAQPVAVDTYNGTITGDLAATLSTRNGLPDATGPRVMMPVAFHPTQDPISSAEVCHSIGANENATAAVAIGADCFNGDLTGEVSMTLKAAEGNPAVNHPTIIQAMQVRRLTPVECERLQGFPDNYTAIPWRKKPTEDCPDGPRYKALGNSMAVPVMAWIGQRLAAVAAIEQPREVAHA